MCKKVDHPWCTCAKRQILSGVCMQKWILSGDQKGLYQPLSYLAVNHCGGDLQHVQASQLTIQHAVVAVMGCQSSVCVMYSMCNLLGNQLVSLEIEINLYLWFKMVNSRNTVQFLNEKDCIHECQHRKSVQKYLAKYLSLTEATWPKQAQNNTCIHINMEV